MEWTPVLSGDRNQRIFENRRCCCVEEEDSGEALLSGKVKHACEIQLVGVSEIKTFQYGGGEMLPV